MREMAQPPLPTETRLAHYRVESPLGEGAMGVVYRAHDEGLDRPVALKVIREEVAEDQAFVRRFMREARAAARVTHPNLTHVYYVGEEDGRRFFAMEYIDGEDLETHVQKHGPLELALALDVVVQAARGLGAAHAAGLVHRDVKPSNILLQPDGVGRITDFGLSKSLDMEVAVSQAGSMTGTPLYMSPEQCRSQDVDARSDIYSLGLTLYYLLAGDPPFAAESLGQVIDAQLNKPIPELSAVRPDLPVGFDDVLRRMCSKDVADRPASMEEVIELLEPYRPRVIHRAPLVARAVAAIVDVVVVVAVVALVQLLLMRVLANPISLESAWGYAATYALFIAYHVVAETRWQQTIGKWLLQIEVTARDGAPPPKRRILPRFVLRYPLPVVGVTGLTFMNGLVSTIADGAQLLAILLGVLWYAATRTHSFSDVLTKTRVAIRMSPTSGERPAPAGKGR